VENEFKYEHDLQVWFTTQLNRKGIFYFAVPNGGQRNKIEAIRLNSEGVRSGVADLVLMLENGKALFVELKILKGVQSPNQKEFERNCIMRGFDYLLLKGRASCELFLNNFENKFDKNGFPTNLNYNDIKPIKFEDL
jgi:hypothetical protein